MADDSFIYVKPKTEEGTTGLDKEIPNFEKKIMKSYAEIIDPTIKLPHVYEDSDL